MKYILTGNVGNLGVHLVLEPEPDDPANPPPPPLVEDTDPLLVQLPGTFFVSSEDKPTFGVARNLITPPPGDYESVRMDFDFVHGGWSDERPRGRHNIFWFVHEGNFNMLGYLMSVGTQNVQRFVHGVRLKQDDKLRIERRGPSSMLVEGHKYHVAFKYDYRARLVTLQILEGAETVVYIFTEPNTADKFLRVKDKEIMRLDFGFTGEEPSEPPSIGWEFSDLVVSYTPAGT